MKKNLGNIDRVVRILFFVVVAILYFTGTITGALGIILGLLGIVLLLTAFVGFCPIYATFKLSTLKKLTKAS